MPLLRRYWMVELAGAMRELSMSIGDVDDGVCCGVKMRT